MELITSPDKRRRRIAAVGMYDGVHLGHRFLIDFLKAQGRERGLSPAVVTFDRHPRQVVRPVEAPPLLTTLFQRAHLLEATGVEDCIVLPFTRRTQMMSAREFLQWLRQGYGVEALVVGFNNRFGRDRAEGLEQYRDMAAQIGMEVVQAPEYKGKHAPVSSSRIRERLLQGDPEGAALLLGHPYQLVGRVRRGRGLGRGLGYPTANVEPAADNALLPQAGVYAAVATTPDGRRRPAMVNVGTCPTVASDGAAPRLTVEAHVLDFMGYIYDEEIALDFVKRLRDERKFPSREALSKQLADDEKAVRKLKL